MKDRRFLVMIMELTAVMVDHLNLVATMALISIGMKIASVLVTFKSSSHLTPLLPKQ